MNKNLTIETLKGGAAIEMVNKELERVFSDIADINKQGDSKRQVTLTISFNPSEDARVGGCKISVSSSLGKQKPVTATVFFGFEGGKGVAAEQQLNQPSFEMFSSDGNQ